MKLEINNNSRIKWINITKIKSRKHRHYSNAINKESKLSVVYVESK